MVFGITRFLSNHLKIGGADGATDPTGPPTDEILR